MFGAIYGDVIGSSYEVRCTKNYNFEFRDYSIFTDDTVLTVAVCKTILNNSDPISFFSQNRRAFEYASQIKHFYSLFPDAGFGQMFSDWARSSFMHRVKSYGNGASMRVIPIPRQLVPMLREMRKKNGSKYVVGNGDKVISVRSYQRTYELMLKKHGLPHRGFHALRHTFATRALECGMDVKTLSEILGHKNSSVTLNRYAHSLMDHKKDMMNRLGKLFSE